METVDPVQMAMLDLNDLGNAERLKRRAQGRLRHVLNQGWVAYDAGFWSIEDGQRLALRMAHDVARGFRAEITSLRDIADEDLGEALFPGCTAEWRKTRVIELTKYAIDSGNAGKSKAMLAQAEELLGASRDDFDRDPLAFNVLNGTLRFVKGPDGWGVRLDGHDPRDMITRQAEVIYDPKAEAPKWIERLELVQEDDGRRGYLRDMMGYTMLGYISEQCFFMHQGKGGDGKSLTMAVITTILGSYHTHADIQTFLIGGNKSGSDHSSDLARLAGDIRMVTCDEPKKGSVLNETRLKQVTGGGRVTARPLGKPEIEFIPRWALHMEVNPRPRIPGADDGIWRRIKPLWWKHQFGKAGGDKRANFDALKAELLVERSGILNWMIAGAIAWLDGGGLVEPAEVTAAVEDYRKTSNPFGDWVQERLDFSDPLALTGASVFYEDYKEWCDRNGIADGERLTSTKFGRELGDLQITLGPKDSRGNKRRKGAKLKPAGADMLDAPAGPPAGAGGGAYSLDDDDFDPLGD